MSRSDVGRDDEVGFKHTYDQGPEVQTENHDVEVDVHVIVARLHTLLELVCELCTQANIWQGQLAFRW